MSSAAALPNLERPLRTKHRAELDAAVIVGIEDYLVAPDVPYATRDAELFRDLMRYTHGIPSSRIELLQEGATREAIETAVHRLGASVPEGGTLWFFFAGHGAASPTTGERLLLGDDVRQDPAVFEARAVSVSAITALATAGGGRAVLVLDTCYAGQGRGGTALAPGGEVAPARYEPASSERAVVWTAASPSETSGPLEAVAHGAFTWFATGALRGWADGALDGQRDGAVTAAEAQHYVADALRSVQVVSQRPVLSTLAPQRARLTAAGERGPELADLRAELARIEAMPALEHAVPAPEATLESGLDRLEFVRTPAGVLGRERIGSLLVATTEVPQWLHEQVAGPPPKGPFADDLPAWGLSITDAFHLCNELSTRLGLEPAYQIVDNPLSDTPDVLWDPAAEGFRLPTPTEWRYLAGAGEEDPSWFAGVETSYAWIHRTSGGVMPVARLAPNPWGLYDMVGNAEELVWDDRISGADNVYASERGQALGATYSYELAASRTPPLRWTHEVGPKMYKVSTVRLVRGPALMRPDKPAGVERVVGVLTARAAAEAITAGAERYELVSIEAGEHRGARVEGFLLGTTEVPRWLYEAVLGTPPVEDGGPEHPVRGLTVADAARLCNALSERQGLRAAYAIEEGPEVDTLVWDHSADGYRLPTIQEWRHAALAGGEEDWTKGRTRVFGWAGGTDDGIQPVAGLSPSPWGLYDLVGNVEEMVWDEKLNRVEADRYGSHHVRTLGGNWSTEGAGLWERNGLDTRYAGWQGLRLARSP